MSFLQNVLSAVLALRLMLHASAQHCEEACEPLVSSLLLQNQKPYASKAVHAADKTSRFRELFPSAHLEDLHVGFDAPAKASILGHPSWQAFERNLSKEDNEKRKSWLRMFNPSLFRDAGGSMRLLARVSTKSRCCGKQVCKQIPPESWHYYSVVMCRNQSNVIRCSDPVEGLDDPHGFTLKGRSYALANTWRYDADWIEHCKPKLLDLHAMTVLSVHLPNASLCEKNWSPFVEDGKLLMTYAISPEHQVLRCNATTRLSCEITYRSDTFLIDEGLPSSLKMNSVHGSTPHVELDEQYLLSMAHRHSKANRDYWHTFYVIERWPPYRIVANTPWFQFPVFESDGNDELASIQYAGGLTHGEEGELVVAFGVGDCFSRSLRLSVDAVKQALNL